MAWLPNSIFEDVEDAHVRVFYVSGRAAKLWAETRDKDEPRVFTGFYWAEGAREAGPFKTRSAAIRDAWYRVVAKRTPPNLRARNDTFKRKCNSVTKTPAKHPARRSRDHHVNETRVSP